MPKIKMTTDILQTLKGDNHGFVMEITWFIFVKLFGNLHIAKQITHR